jgi:hypothetical protein
VNGDFEKPNLNKGWKIINNPPGWLGATV